MKTKVAKIVDVQAWPLAVPLKEKGPRSPRAGRLSKQIVVKVLTDDGMIGVGEAPFSRCPPIVTCAIIEEGLKPYLLGEDPTQIEKLVEKLHRNTFTYTRRGLGLNAISGIEIALWDLAGKMRGIPVASLLVDPVKPRSGLTPAYFGMRGRKRPARLLKRMWSRGLRRSSFIRRM